MPTSSREFIQTWWRDAQSDGLWAASWSKSLDGLTAAQAAWSPGSPAGPRHSIWQIALHMVYWRERWLRRIATGLKPASDDLSTLNFPIIADTSEDAWSAARTRLADTHTRMAAALNDPAISDEHFRILAHFLPHDAYHFGQINYLRAMHGLPPIE